MEQVPHFTSSQKAGYRLLESRFFNPLLKATVHQAQQPQLIRRRPRLTAINTSDFEAEQTSRYFTRRPNTSGKHGRTGRVMCKSRTMSMRVKYKGKTYHARIRRVGTVRYDGVVYKSPSAAGNAVRYRQTNGRGFWQYERAPGEWVPLTKIRE